MKVLDSIFRNYDIRGLAPEEITLLVAEHLGKAFGTFAQTRFGKSVVIGHDNRKTSEEIKNKFVFGLISTGCNVIDIGLSLTPIIQFLTFERKYDAGVMVTASHNPKEYNGFRFIGKKATQIFGSDLVSIRELIQLESYKVGMGDVSYDNLLDLYTDYLLQSFRLVGKHKILVDCGNGTTSVLVKKLFSDLNQNVEGLFCNLDSEYPHGVPDPEEGLFMRALSERVVKGNFECGFAYDTDGDRFGVVDDLGNIYSNDKLLLLFVTQILKENKGATVLYDVKSSSLVDKVVRSLGGKPIMIRTGHPYFNQGIRDGALVGAEFSGHTFFGDRYLGFDDGVYASLRILEILDKSGKKLSELMSVFPKTYHTLEIKVRCQEEEKFQIVQMVEDSIKTGTFVKDYSSVDGIRCYIQEDSWFLIRASNTGAYISIRFESASKNDLESLIGYVRSLHPILSTIKEPDIIYS